MQWWNEFVTWFNSAAGMRVITTAILPFLAILVAGILAALIARSFSKRVIEHQDREIKAAAIMALIGAGRRAAVWSSLGADEKQHVDSLISEADLRMRLLPVSGAIAAADWSTHELNAMKKNSSNFSFQAEQTFFDYRDRLLDWQLKPAKAKKLFAFDLVQWQYEDGDKSAGSIALSQQEWSVDRVSPLDRAAPPTATEVDRVTPPPAAVVSPAVVPAAAAPTAPATPTAPVAATAPALVDPVSTAPASTVPASAVPASAPTSFAPTAPVIVTPSPETASPETSEAASTPAGLDAESQPETVSDEDTTIDDDTAPRASATDIASASDADADAVDEDTNPFAPPVNAGAVRARTAPDQSLENS